MERYHVSALLVRFRQCDSDHGLYRCVFSGVPRASPPYRHDQASRRRRKEFGSTKRPPYGEGGDANGLTGSWSISRSMDSISKHRFPNRSVRELQKRAISSRAGTSLFHWFISAAG
ncbi:hypothetical protein OS493_001806 [Desmophyllum pertusum]|uniref:Uncharacterized protein n=1 Tax=Desmophyllum pertusum TaxID=174260 RepID=A0A9X0CVN4_9CNID|nr:hypothetical protein OS493_001806 [Desmophyllum pertusum]